MGLREIYYGIEDKYYALIDWLSNNGLNLKPLVTAIETKGIPSLPLFTAILLLLIGGVYLYLNPSFIQGVGGDATLSITVKTASNEPVEGALVTITGAGVSQSASTGSNGAATFTGISKGTKLRVAVSKDGFAPISRDLIAGGASVPFILKSGAGGQVTLLVVSQENIPVPNAQVSYIVNGETRNTVTSQQGIALLSAPVGASVTVTVTGQGFDSVTETFAPDSPGFQYQITLAGGLGTIGDFTGLAGSAYKIPSPDDDEQTTSTKSIDLSTKVTVHVDVLNSSGGKLQGAVAVLFNNADQSVLATGNTDAEGRASFTEVPSGVQAYVAVDAEGFVSQTSGTKVLQQGTIFTVSMPVISDVSASNLTVSFADDGFSTAFTVEFFVLDSATHQVLKTMVKQAGKTRVVASLPAGKTVYVSGLSEQHVRFATENFALVGGANNSLLVSLTKKTPENSVIVKVNTVGFYGDSIKAFVTPFLAGNGKILLPGANSSTSGVAELKNTPLQSIVVKATNGTFYGEGSLTVSLENTNVTISLLPVPGEVRLRAVDLFTGNDLTEQATFTVFYKQGAQVVKLAGCPASNTDVSSATALQNGLCTLALSSAVVYSVKVSAGGYFDKVQTFVLSPNNVKQEEVTLIPTTSNDVLVGPAKLYKTSEAGTDFSYDSAELQKEDASGLYLLEPGVIYTAFFDVVFKPGTTGTGVYMRVGDESSIASGNAVIYKGFPLDDPEHINSGLFTLTGSNSFSLASCGSSVSPNQVGTFKWLDAFLPSEKYGGQSGRIKISLLVTKSTPSRLNLSTRGYGIFTDGTYVRSPVDSELQTAKETSNKKECAATPFSTEYKVISSGSALVNCGSQACLTLSFKQGQRQGLEGFTANPAVIGEETLSTPLEMHYSLIDFNPNFDEGTPLTFQTNKQYMVVLLKKDQSIPLPLTIDDFQVSLGENSYKAIVKTPRKITGAVKANPLVQQYANFPISLSFGSKASVDTVINLAGLPQPIAALAPLPSHYALQYSDADEFSLVQVTGNNVETKEGIDFLSDPILPADAVMLLLNFSDNAPCKGKNSLNFKLTDVSTCFEQVDNPQSSLSLPEEYKGYGDNLIMFKYDASSEKCALYSRNPNKVKVAAKVSQLKVISTCTQKAIEIPLNVLANSELTKTQVNPPDYTGGSQAQLVEFKQEYSAIVKKERAWEEPSVSNLGVDASYLHVLINNRQYSRDNYVPVYLEGDEDSLPSFFFVGDNPVNIPIQGIKPILTRDAALPDLLGSVGEAPQLLKVHDPTLNPDIGKTLAKSLDIEEVAIDNQADSMEFTGEQVLNVLRNTAFRRRELCKPPLPCPFGLFPYNVFVDAKTKPLKYNLGGDLWSGKFGDGNVEFEFYGLAGDACTGREQEGLYNYYWTYSIDDQGNYVQSKKFSPIELKNIDYATFGCSVEKKNLCGKLSLSGGSCINNCGDGWYYGAFPGLTNALCSGNNFKVEDVRSSSGDQRNSMFERFYKNIPNALISCFAQEYAGAYAGCAVGSSFGPVGGLVGTRLGAFVAGQAYDAVFAEKLNSMLNIDPVEGDVPGFTTFLGKWSQACSYAGTALDVANAIRTLKGVASLGNYHCPGAFDYALSSCFCFNKGNLGGGLDPECAAEKAVRLVVSSNAFRDSKTSITTLASDVASAGSAKTAALKTYTERKKDAGTSLCSGGSCNSRAELKTKMAGTSNPAEKAKLEAVDDALDELGGSTQGLDEAIGRAKASGLCTQKDDTAACAAKMKAIDDKLGIVDKAVDAVCGPLLTTASAMLVIGSFAADAPERGYIAVNDEGNSDFGGKLGLGGPDVDCVDNTNTDQDNLDVWMDLDFSSLRVKEGQEVHCMDKQSIATYAPEVNAPAAGEEGGINPSAKEMTFYITSRG